MSIIPIIMCICSLVLCVTTATTTSTDVIWEPQKFRHECSADLGDKYMAAESKNAANIDICRAMCLEVTQCRAFTYYNHEKSLWCSLYSTPCVGQLYRFHTASEVKIIVTTTTISTITAASTTAAITTTKGKFHHARSHFWRQHGTLYTRNIYITDSIYGHTCMHSCVPHG